MRAIRQIEIILFVGLALACRQNLDLPKAGTPEAEVRQSLGEPSRNVDQPRELVEQYIKGLDACSGDLVSKTARVWLYEKDAHQVVVVAIGQNGTVLCAGHRGITLVQ